jgi:hypothetical protein
VVSDICEEEAQPVVIPEKYRPLIREVAEWLGADMVCYINAHTLELAISRSIY